MEPRSNVHYNSDGVSSETIPLEGYSKRSTGSPVSSSLLHGREDTDEYWQGGPFEHDGIGGQQGYRDAVHDPSATMSTPQQDVYQVDGPRRQLSTSKTQGVHQQTYDRVRASDDPGQYPPVIPPGKTPSFLGTWWLELVSIFLVVGMLAAIVGTVYPYRNKPQPSWPYGVQLNSVVSAYILVLKTFVILVISTGLGQLKWSWFRQAQPLDHLAIYDDASRGVWGSLGLLFSLRRRTVLPYLGALLMVLATILDPLGQQLISFYSCQVYDASINSSLPTTTYATVGLDSHIGAGLSSLAVGSQSSINIGIYSNNLQNVTFSCPTGNCTYPDNYATAGWCSSCQDVTDQLHIVRPDNSTANTGYNYTLPSTNLTVSNFYGESFKIGVDMGDSDAWGVRVQTIMAMGEANVSDTPWGVRGYGAAECSFAACATSLRGNVALGALAEDVAESSVFVSSDYGAGGGWTSTLYVPCLNDSERRTVTSRGYPLDGGNATTFLPYNLSDWAVRAYNPRVDNATATTIRPQCIYQSYYVDVSSLSEYLSSLFEGSLSGFYGVQGSSVLSTIFDDSNVTFASVDATMARVAQALSVWGRENADNTTQALVGGTAYRSTTCVAVGWWWLVYPVVLAAATILFLFGTALWTRSAHAGSRLDWKNEVLPLMFCGIERVGKGVEGQGAVGAVNDMRGVSEQARGIEVRLDQGANGWRFVETDRGSAIR